MKKNLKRCDNCNKEAKILVPIPDFHNKLHVCVECIRGDVKKLLESLRNKYYD